MSATNVSNRFGAEGKAEIKAAFEKVGQSGQAAFASVEKAMERTGAASELALWLAGQGKTTTLVEIMPAIPAKAGPLSAPTPRW